jgi:hypothetical protein
MLFAEWLGIAVIGGILYFIARDTQIKYPLNESNSLNVSANGVGIWLIIIIGFLLFYLFGANAGVKKEWFGSLFASALPSTLIWYVLGILVIYKLSLTRAMKIAGFLIAWLATAVTALLMAEETSAISASYEMLPAGFIGVIFGLLLISFPKIIVGIINSKQDIFNSFISKYFEIFGYQMLVGSIYMTGSISLAPEFPGIINLPFLDLVTVLSFSVFGPALLSFTLLLPWHTFKKQPLWQAKSIALLSLILVILDFTKILPILTGTEGLGAYTFIQSRR